MKPTARQERAVVRAAMKVHRTWKRYSYYQSGQMYDAVATLDKACAALTRKRK